MAALWKLPSARRERQPSLHQLPGEEQGLAQHPRASGGEADGGGSHPRDRPSGEGAGARPLFFPVV